MGELNEMFNRLNIPQEKRDIITQRLKEKFSYKPKIGFFGKTGVGKSSLCNAIFGQKICQISDTEACTRKTQEVLLSLGGQGITLVDVPGVGESQERDKEYGNLYAKLLPTLDLVFWVLKGDDRAFSSDERFYKNIVRPHEQQGKPFFFVINQVDKVEPFREWNMAGHCPGVNQLSNIDKKIIAVSNAFSCPKGKVIPVSAEEKYNLDVLVDTFIDALPREQKYTVGRTVKQENVSKPTEKVIKKAWWETVAEVVKGVAVIAKVVWDIFFKEKWLED